MKYTTILKVITKDTKRFIFAYFLCPNTFVNACISVSSHWQQIWCAAGVNLTGGKTRDGGSVVGASVFYSSPPESEADPRKEVKDEVDRLNQELKVIANTMFVDFMGYPCRRTYVHTNL